jgi:hypothetical protein
MIASFIFFDFKATAGAGLDFSSQSPVFILFVDVFFTFLLRMPQQPTFKTDENSTNVTFLLHLTVDVLHKSFTVRLTAEFCGFVFVYLVSFFELQVFFEDSAGNNTLDVRITENFRTFKCRTL